jgi:hypothetical protein
MKKQLTICLALLILLCTSAHAQLPSYLPADGLVGWWPFNGNANDESGNGNDGVVNGATLTEDRSGIPNSAFAFDGINDFISISSASSLQFEPNLSFSVSLWLNSGEQVTNPNGYNGILGKSWSSGSTPPRGWQIGRNNSTFQFQSRGGDDLNNQNGNGPCGMVNNEVLIGENIHLVYVFDRQFDSIKIYINDLQIDGLFCINISENMSNNAPLLIGVDREGTFFSSGVIDDIAIYNRALTEQEIQNIYTGTNTTTDTGDGAAPLPQGIPYQAAARDANGQPVADSPVSVRFSLREGAADGVASYIESHSLTTNSIGLFNTVFGNGTPEQSAFDSINWAATTKFLQVEVDLGNGYVDMGTTQLLSVPYAFRSAQAANIKNATLPVYPDNAAALAGGLVAGEMYRTATGDLKIVY